jgi:hypothetical protein
MKKPDPIEADPADAFRENTLERMIYDTLRAAGPRGVTVSYLYEVLYGSTTRVDPESGKRNIWVTIYHVRKKLKAYGALVIRHPVTSRYRLELEPGRC